MIGLRSATRLGGSREHSQNWYSFLVQDVITGLKRQRLPESEVEGGSIAESVDVKRSTNSLDKAPTAICVFDPCQWTSRYM